MVQLIAFLLVVAALVILVLQNLSPVLPLVVLGSSVGALPFSVWLLGAIAIGVLCTLLIYQLVPQKRTYRPMGKRLSDPAPEPTNRFVDSPSPSDSSSTRFQPERQNPYDNDWETFKAPEQWDDWGQQQGYASSYDSRERPSASAGDSVDDAVRDIESGWENDNYEARYSSRQDAGPDIGWDDRGVSYDNEQGAYGSERSPRTYDEGWLYGNDANEGEPARPAEPEEPQPEDSEDDVYDANYRVIIPPYDAKND